MSLRRATDCLLAGALWGGLAGLLGSRAFGDHIWAAVLASPLIGLATGMLMQEPFERLAGWRRGLVALGSVYLGATLFGAIVGLVAAVSTGGTPRTAVTRLGEARGDRMVGCHTWRLRAFPVAVGLFDALSTRMA